MVSSFTRLSHHALDLNRWRYFARCVTGYIKKDRWHCPNCGGRKAPIQQGKHFVTRLLRCETCKLLFRAPTDPPDFGKEFYQDDYQQGFTTDCPTDANLNSMLEKSFSGTPKDFAEKIDLLHRLGLPQGARVLDFGASWGYGTWQFSRAGFDAVGFEPSRRRARYAEEKLDVQVFSDETKLDTLVKEKPFDAVFSSHVLEHVPKPSSTIEKTASWLRPGGFLVAYTPNGSVEYRNKDPQGYRNHWGMVHPNYLDAKFYEEALKGWTTYITGTPVDKERLSAWDQRSPIRERLTSWELLVIAKRR